MYPSVRQLHTRSRRADERIAAREMRIDSRSHDCIVERPRWFEDLARPPYERGEDRNAEVERR